MKARLFWAFLALFLATLTLRGASAHGVASEGIEIRHAWVRAVVMAGMNGGGYVHITNNGHVPDRLLAVESDIAKRVELHRTREHDGMMHMEPMEEGVELPVGQSVSLEPGGMHVMFMGVSRPLQEGEHVPAVFVFEKAGRIETYFAVQPLDGSEMSHH